MEKIEPLHCGTRRSTKTRYTRSAQGSPIQQRGIRFPRGIIYHENIGQLIKLNAPPEGPFLEYEKEYQLYMFVLDKACTGAEIKLGFKTMAEP